MYIFSVAQQPKSEAGRLILRLLDPTQTHTSARAGCRLFAETAYRRGRYSSHNRPQTSNIHAFRWIRNSCSKNQAAACLRFRPSSVYVHMDNILK